MEEEKSLSIHSEVKDDDLSSGYAQTEDGSPRTESEAEARPETDVTQRQTTASQRPLSESNSIQSSDKGFDFHKRTDFDAMQNILQSRSESYILKQPPPDYNIWNRKPPDFRPQGFAPRPPPRNSKYAVKPWLYKTPKDSYYDEALKNKKDEIILPDIAKPKVTQSLDRPAFIRRFHTVGPEEARHLFVKEGKFPDEPYVPPQPHDFRGYPPIKSLGLDEFLTKYERDPFNIKFNTARPRTLVGAALGVTERDILPGPAFAPPLRQPPKWEARLHYPREKFPNRPQDYTRYRRRNRDVHSAFLDRVEESLTVQWCREKMEKALRDQQTPREVKVN